MFDTIVDTAVEIFARAGHRLSEDDLAQIVFVSRPKAGGLTLGLASGERIILAPDGALLRIVRAG
ncbi:MAG: hypothetical protein KatS3mg082_3378 [Nitrospiraceae bacterium]|nr:MAG: hypothetical protein KatS3mg051_1843 [Anaerolineae bacterium]GIW56974.1 MAG: hypothetical protein KatS3mg082_3378 [Nitrospiraceae bacterium]